MMSSQEVRKPVKWCPLLNRECFKGLCELWVPLYDGCCFKVLALKLDIIGSEIEK